MSKINVAETTKVQYRDIEGYPGYRVGNDGSMWSNWKRESLGNCGGTRVVIGTEWKLMNPPIQRSGHLLVGLRRDGIKRRFYVHRLVLTAFVGPCPEGMEACHNDGNPANNAVGNLRWDTRKSNHADRIRHGTDQRGERCGNAKLTNSKVIEIRAKYASRCFTQKELAVQYGVDQTNISDIVTRRTWTLV